MIRCLIATIFLLVSVINSYSYTRSDFAVSVCGTDAADSVAVVPAGVTAIPDFAFEIGRAHV